MASQFIQEKNPISMIDFIIKKKTVHTNTPLSNLLVKINYFGHRELLAPKVLLI